MSQLISKGYIQGQEQSHDDGVIFSKVQITMKAFQLVRTLVRKAQNGRCLID
ncbi:hypothetical protein L1077_03140 [Pseudoalteromonas luteoviolacea]|uniref:hypothetical protein n=1 Tax=Pseudoalteromonas luteoviolacea TaxID=43657 RepID=UPI001F2800D7|nr:hypothetical protein [Pseudoalteromonas luteoviolacea]MCF6438425.1 hypothetical protein [Pseudoalteromonas luteoviolacea]